MPAAAWGYFAGEHRGQRPRRVEGRRPHAGVAALHVPAPAQGDRSSASPTSSGPSNRATRLRRVPRGDDGRRAPASASRSCSPPTGTRSTCSLHGLSVEMTEALAELWHRRIREEWGFADEDGPSLAGPVPPAVPRVALLVGLPGVPRPRRPGEGRRAARDRPHRRDAHRGVPPRARADRRRRSSSPTPRPSTSSSSDAYLIRRHTMSVATSGSRNTPGSCWSTWPMRPRYTP